MTQKIASPDKDKLAISEQKSMVEAYLEAQTHKSLLRFITCGSVDDGKSTLIGRLLYDAKMIFEDQLQALSRDSKKMGTQGEEIDFALLVDGLAAEREQGITIDVAYRFFATERRKFIVADTPGHAQYTRNMATGASNADLAILLVDARQGILDQTRRHSAIVSLLGIRHVVVAVNKMDLIGYDQASFEQLSKDYCKFAGGLGFETIQIIPLSALKGDNMTSLSPQTPWYHGPCLMDYLETIDVTARARGDGLRFPVQWVNRPHQDFRGFSGQIAAGCVKPGDMIKVLPSGRESKVKKIVSFDGDLTEAIAGEAITLCLEDEIDISRGDVIISKDAPLEVADQFEARLIWMDEAPLLPGRPYLIKIHNQNLSGVITDLKYKIDIETMGHGAAKTLKLNDIGQCTLSFDRAVAFEPYRTNRTLGGFLIIDRQTNRTVGAGMIDFALRRSANIHWQALDVNKEARAQLMQQAPVLLWFTGLSGSGKSTIANLVEKQLFAQGVYSYILDGDNIRHGLNKDLGFTDADRVESIRRIGEVSGLMVDAGLVVMTSFISPFRAERQMVRSRLGAGEFIEIFIDTPYDICARRDPKGLYKKVKDGKIRNFTGFDSPYEAPLDPEIHIKTVEISAIEAARKILDYLKENGYLQGKI